MHGYIALGVLLGAAFYLSEAADLSERLGFVKLSFKGSMYLEVKSLSN